MISIVDYGVGNVQAFLNLFNRLGIEAKRANTSAILKESSHLILPGVGHFDHAMKKLNNSGLREPLEDLVIGLKIPLLGICVGMQMLANESEEGVLPGLGWIPAKVRAFSNNKNSLQLPLPHMGWNNINIKKSTILSKKKINRFTEFYFLHSYYFDAVDKSIVSATSNYGLNFDSMISYENIHGVQFHPEKSHKWGEELLKSFSKL
jgi:glutamine amidotransferase